MKLTKTDKRLQLYPFIRIRFVGDSETDSLTTISTTAIPEVSDILEIAILKSTNISSHISSHIRNFDDFFYSLIELKRIIER